MAGKKFSLSAITDGTSNTVMLSKSTLGTGTEGTSTNPNNHRTTYAYAGSVMTLTESACASALQWNMDYRRGYSWTAGEYRCASYNHFYAPNAKTCDCIANNGAPSSATGTTPFGLRAARSWHTGGVNTALLDGSVQFVSDTVALDTWRAYSTRNGGEAASF